MPSPAYNKNRQLANEIDLSEIFFKNTENFIPSQRFDGQKYQSYVKIDNASLPPHHSLPRRVHPAVRKTGLFTHGRANLRGDVSGKRFSMHAGERNVARIGDGGCGNDKGMESAEGE